MGERSRNRAANVGGTTGTTAMARLEFAGRVWNDRIILLEPFWPESLTE